MGKGSALCVTDLLEAEVWAYTPPQGTGGVFTGKRPRIRSKQEQRESRRGELFSRFDDGIQLDEEMWWSVTPEQLALHTAERCRCDLILDGFAGAGGNTIAFTKSCGFVISCEIDPIRIQMAKANAAVYGSQVTSRVDFIIGDFATLTSRQLRRGALDVVFLSPPWGGPSYNAREVFDLTRMGGMIDFRHALRLAQRVAPRVAAFLPRSVSLLPLLRAAAMFNLRGFIKEADATAQSGDGIATSSPAVKSAANATANEFAGDCDGEEAPTYEPPLPRMHIELALCRSRRDGGSFDFDQLGCCTSLAQLASGLSRVVWKACRQGENSPEDCAHEQEEESNRKRRRINSVISAGQPSVRRLAGTAHGRRWEAAEAAEEEVRLLEEGEQIESNGALKGIVRERRKVYKHIDDLPREWRWLPVELLWAATPLTKGFVRDPFYLLNRHLRAAQKKGQNGEFQKQTEAHPEPDVWPFLDDLRCSLFPCACRHINFWRWRAVGVTAFFGPFADRPGVAQRQANVAAHDIDRAATRSRSVGESELHGQQQALDDCDSLQEVKRIRRSVKRIFRVLLPDVLTLTGIHNPELGFVGDERYQELPGGEHPLGPSLPSTNPHPERQETEVNSNLVDLKADPDGATGETAMCSYDLQPCTQGAPLQAASSIACFAKQAFTQCSSSSEKLCNCFYSQASSETCQPWVHGQPSGMKSTTSDPNPPSDDCHSESEGGGTQREWRAFVRRLVAAAAKKVAKARDMLASGRCCCGADWGAEPHRCSKTACAWHSLIWNECGKLLHSYLAAASSYSTTLRLALPRPVSKKQRRKRHRLLPLSAEPLPPASRQDFLRRIISAYISLHCCPASSQADTEKKPTGSPPAEAANASTDRGIGSQTLGDNEVQRMGSDNASGMWTPEEVVYWQFGCSMWCNPALHVLSARHLAPLLKLHSCTRG